MSKARISGQEVAKHNNRDSCWIIVHGMRWKALPGALELTFWLRQEMSTMSQNSLTVRPNARRIFRTDDSTDHPGNAGGSKVKQRLTEL